MSCKSKDIIHLATYIEYTGYYALCRVNRPELDYLETELTQLPTRVTCKDCKKGMRNK